MVVVYTGSAVAGFSTTLELANAICRNVYHMRKYKLLFTSNFDLQVTFKVVY